MFAALNFFYPFNSQSIHKIKILDFADHVWKNLFGLTGLRPEIPVGAMAPTLPTPLAPPLTAIKLPLL